MAIRPFVDEEACIACGMCASVCPATPNCFAVTDKSRVVSPDSCIGCRACEENCPVSCITVREPA